MEPRLRTPDGIDLQLTRWPTAASPPRATVLVVHGLGEHAGRHGGLAARLGEIGFDVHAYDQRGHGRSGGPRGGLPADESMLTDLSAVIGHLRAQAPGPLVLLGHSMGGLVAARFVAEELQPVPAAWSQPVDALVLSSPALDAELNPLQKLLMAIGALLPDMPAGNGLRPEWISRDPAVVEAYVDDPLVHDRITPRLARFILRGGAQVRAVASRWRTPTLLLWAGADRCVAPKGSAAFAAAAPAGAVRARAFEGLYHEIFNEPERDEVLAQLAGWLDERLPQRG
jgi:alpha-beta hydrolase superfamily lysophospholipase